MPRRVEIPLVDTPPADDEITAADAAGVLDQGRNTVRLAIQSGALPAVRRAMVGRPTAWQYWVRADDVARYKRYLDLRPHTPGRPKASP